MGIRSLAKASLFASVLLAGVWTFLPAALGQETVELRGFVLRDGLTGAALERAVLRSEGPGARKYRALTGLFVLRAPSEESWNEVIVPALNAAIDSPRPIQALRSTMLGMGDALIGSPDDSSILMSFELPGDRGQGAVSFVAPVLVGPKGGKTGHVAPNRARVVTGVQVDPVSGRDPVVVEAIGLPNLPRSWVGDALRLADLEAIPYGGEGAWVKYKGKVLAEGDETDPTVLDKLSEQVLEMATRDSLRVDRLLSWPGRIGDDADLTDTLRSVRYDSRVPEVEKRLVDELRRPGTAVKWRDKRIKHPTRFGIATLPISAEVVVGRKLVERTEVLAFVYFYTPLFVSFNQAHLYLSVTPDVVFRSVQAGELPFFLWKNKAYFYLPHLDRWLSGKALEIEGKTTSRKRVVDVADSWAGELDRKLAKQVREWGEDPMVWPLRMVPREGDSERAFKVRVSLQDLGSWFHRLKSAVAPKVPLLKPTWAVDYSGKSHAYDLHVLFSGGRVVLEDGAGQVSAVRGTGGQGRGPKTTPPPKVNSGGRRKGAMTRESNVDLRMKQVTVGTPAKGKPYLLTRAGRTVPVKVTFLTRGGGPGHKARVVAQVYDPSGAEMKDFRARSGSVSVKEGEGSITTYLKVPKRLYGKQGAYKVRTHLELDGAAVGGAREEFLYLGSALTMKRMELDPSVVVPGEEVVLILDLNVAGWGAAEKVPLTIDIRYKVGGKTLQDSFKISRGVGSHQLEIDLRVPETLVAGDGGYKVMVSSADGNKSGKSGTLRVFEKALVDAEGGRQRRGLSLRVEDDDDELLAAARAARAAKSSDDREVVKAERSDDVGEDLFGDDSLDESSPTGTPAASSEPAPEAVEQVFADLDEDLDLDFGEENSAPSGDSSEDDDEDDSLDFDEGRGNQTSAKQRRELDWDSKDEDEPGQVREAQRRGDEDARREQAEKRRAAKTRKAEERRRSRAERGRERERETEGERESSRRRRPAASSAGSGDSVATKRGRRGSSSSSTGATRRPQRGKPDEASGEDEVGSVYDEDEEYGSSYEQDDEFSGSLYEEDEDFDLDGESGDGSDEERESEASPKARSRRDDGNKGRSRRSRDAEEEIEEEIEDEPSGRTERSEAGAEDESYWLDGSRDDPDALISGDRGDELSDDVAYGRSATGLPAGVYSEDEESNAVSRARRRGMGIVWVNGGSESSVKRWYSLYEGTRQDGGESWVWIFSEGSGGGELRFKRFSKDENRWKAVYRVPASLSDARGQRKLRDEVLQVLRGYVPESDRQVPFGRF